MNITRVPKGIFAGPNQFTPHAYHQAVRSTAEAYSAYFCEHSFKNISITVNL